MRKRSVFAFTACFVCLAQNVLSHSGLLADPHPLYFTENKGQIKDQFGRSRDDIQFELQTPGMTVFIGNGQLHYQFSKSDRTAEPPLPKIHSGDPFSKQSSETEDIRSASTETYRMDVELFGNSRTAQVVAGEPLPYYENYYLQGTTRRSATAHTFNKITYKNVYPGIDWVLFIRGGKLEHEFTVSPGADAADIRLKYHGQTALTINQDGSLTAETPLGVVNENAPACYEIANGSEVPSAFRLKGNELTYAVSKKSAVVIDPVLQWATYYGPVTTTTVQYGIACNDSGQVYTCGLTWAATDVATTGSFQNVLGGQTDAYIVKFDSLGHRLWATYYGAAGADWGTGIACDKAGNVYMGGTTNSTTAIATPGAQQTTYGGGWDVFLTKFNSAGILQWGTYLGDVADEYGGSVTCDRLGHVYICGNTDSRNNIASPGGFLTVAGGGHNSFLVQYDGATGLRQWGTFYGGDGNDFAGGICTDKFSNVYLAGYTESLTGIASPGGWHTAIYGNSDAFLAKFDVAGSRLWATYYGGEGREATGAVVCDTFANPYMLGNTDSDTGIATPGCDQPLRGGTADAFLATFEPSTGHGVWGTYFGGPDAEDAGSLSRIATDDTGNVYITGNTVSTTGIATTDGWQTTFGGGDNDAFLAKYTNGGHKVWSTYYGGENIDQSTGCAFDGTSIYICGKTNSTVNIATPGAFLDHGGTTAFYYQGFLAKFNVIVPCVAGAISGPVNVCTGDTILLSPTVAGGTWSSGSVAIATVNTSGYVIGLAAGVVTITYQFFAGCYATWKDTVSVCPSGVSVVTGENVTSENAWRLYPNPAGSNLIIAVPPYAYAAFTVCNTMGQQLLKGNILAAETNIDVTSFTPGLYYVILNGEKGPTVKKFLKE